MRKMIVSLASREAQEALLAANKAKAAKAVKDAKDAKTSRNPTKPTAGSGLVGAPPVHEPGVRPSKTPTLQSKMDVFLADTPVLQKMEHSPQDSADREALLPVAQASVPANFPPHRSSLMHTSELVKSYDEGIKMLMRVHGSAKVQDKFYLDVENAANRAAQVLTRLKFFRFLLTNCDTKGVDAVKAFKADSIFLDLSCHFAFKGDNRDYTSIKPDGYCFYRVLFQLYRRMTSFYDLTVEDLICHDAMINTKASPPTPETEEFQQFLAYMPNICKAAEGAEGTTFHDEDRKAFLDAVEVALYCSRAFPGQGIGEDEWGNARWFYYTKTYVCQFTFIENNRASSMAKTVYQGASANDQWSYLTLYSRNKPDTFNIKLVDVEEISESGCNFCCFKRNHFYLLQSPTADQLSDGLNELYDVILTNMKSGVRLIQDRDEMIDRLSKIITSMENNSPVCEIEKHFEVEVFKQALLNEGCVGAQLAKPVVPVIDISADSESEDEKSPEEKTIEELREHVSRLQPQ